MWRCGFSAFLFAVLIFGTGISSGGRSEVRVGNFLHSKSCTGKRRPLLRLRGGAEQSRASVVTGPTGSTARSQKPGKIPGHLAGLVWKTDVEEVEWPRDPTSTDDWSTNEWGEAAWAHFTTKEQLDEFAFPCEDFSDERTPTPAGKLKARSGNRGSTVHVTDDDDTSLSDDGVPFVDELCRDPIKLNPFADVDFDAVCEQLQAYDISSDSDPYDDSASEDTCGQLGKEGIRLEGGKEGAAQRRRGKSILDELIPAVIAAEDRQEQLHRDHPEAFGVLCR